jgi:hypothetical protein
MGKKERIITALFTVIRDIDLPAFKGLKPNDFQNLSLRENLDSLGMVNLIIGMEDALRQEFGKDIPILGRGDAFSTGSMKTAGAFIDYIDQIVEV